MVQNRRGRRGKHEGRQSFDDDASWCHWRLVVGIMVGASTATILMIWFQSSTYQFRNAWADLLTSSSPFAASMVGTSTSSTAGEATRNQKQVRLGRPMRQKRRQHPLFSEKWDIWQRIEAEQTGRVFNETRTEPPLEEREVHFLDHYQLDKLDAYSASWLQRTVDFVHMDLDAIDTCQEAALMAYTNREGDKTETFRMTMDWLDFGVEHLSPWYTMIDVFNNAIPYNFAVSTLEEYLRRAKDSVRIAPALQQTIAVIAFQSFQQNDGIRNDKTNTLTTRTLAATVESLRRAGMGRVVVVGLDSVNDRTLVEESFQLAYMPHNHNKRSDGPVTQLGHLEVAYVDGIDQDAKTTTLGESKFNVPRAALIGLRRAFRELQDGQGTKESIQSWLGEHEMDHWKYVYLTEPDCILNTRPSTLKKLQESVSSGMVLLPWRFQPMPHESDVQHCLKRELFIHQEGEYFYDVHELNALEMHPDKCCDEVKGPDFKAWKEANGEDCGKMWYLCGFDGSEENQKHVRLEQYKLIRLTQGTRFTLLAGQEHGRRCIPHKALNSDVCVAP